MLPRAELDLTQFSLRRDAIRITPQSYRIFPRYSLGETPRTRTNDRRIEFELPRPHALAMSSNCKSVSSNNRRAVSTRMPSTKRAGVFPNARRNVLEKFRQLM